METNSVSIGRMRQTPLGPVWGDGMVESWLQSEFPQDKVIDVVYGPTVHDFLDRARESGQSRVEAHYPHPTDQGKSQSIEADFENNMLRLHTRTPRVWHVISAPLDPQSGEMLFPKVEESWSFADAQTAQQQQAQQQPRRLNAFQAATTSRLRPAFQPPAAAGVTPTAAPRRVNAFMAATGQAPRYLGGAQPQPEEEPTRCDIAGGQAMPGDPNGPPVNGPGLYIMQADALYEEARRRIEPTAEGDVSAEQAIQLHLFLDAAKSYMEELAARARAEGSEDAGRHIDQLKDDVKGTVQEYRDIFDTYHMNQQQIMQIKAQIAGECFQLMSSTMQMKSSMMFSQMYGDPYMTMGMGSGWNMGGRGNCCGAAMGGGIYGGGYGYGGGGYMGAGGGYIGVYNNYAPQFYNGGSLGLNPGLAGNVPYLGNRYPMAYNNYGVRGGSMSPPLTPQDIVNRRSNNS
jgi:hypothetical protein